MPTKAAKTTDLPGYHREAAGDATGNDRLKAEGKGHHVKADLKQAGEKVKGAFREH